MIKRLSVIAAVLFFPALVSAQSPQQQQQLPPSLPVTISGQDYDKLINILVELPGKVSFVPLAILTNAENAARLAQKAKVSSEVPAPPKPPGK